MNAKPTLLWDAVHFAALDHLPRAAAAMGFDRSAGPMPRGGIPCFRTTYQRHRPWQARYPGRPVPDMAATWDAAGRARAAEINRGILWSPCRLLMRPGLAVYVDTVSGDWCDITGGAHGESLIELAKLAWAMPFGKAAFRLSRIVGLEAIPHAG
jgi:hypothetical protein